MTECDVYWKRTKDMTDVYSQGYAGITTRGVDVRNKEHFDAAFRHNSPLTVHQAMRRYGDEVITDLIFGGTIDECLTYENELRPFPHIGWNMAIGGGRPGSGWRLSERWLDTRIWHDVHGEENMSAAFHGGHMYKKYFQHLSRGHVSGGMSKMLCGMIYHYQGWELANLQLRERVRDRLSASWELTHVRLVDNPDHVVKVNRPNAPKFYKAYDLNLSILGHLVQGSQHKKKGWEIATENEWLSTKERIEF